MYWKKRNNAKKGGGKVRKLGKESLSAFIGTREDVACSKAYNVYELVTINCPDAYSPL